MMYHCFSMSNGTSVRKKFDNVLDEPACGAINAKEKDPKKSDRYHHHPCGYKYFAPRRPGNLAHFDAHLVQKTPPLARIFAQLLNCRGDCVAAIPAIAAATVPAIL